VIYPNNDFGSEIILNEYLRFKNDPHFVSYPSMRFEYFLTLLRNADFMIGNSSAGIREASIYGIPAIDIGTRQQGRYKIGVIKNIQHVEDDKGEILKAIDNTPEYRFQEMHFGNGESNKKFIEIISDQTFWNKKLQKKFVDL
jgi:UDP-N-acetylglucosamine 2-epimerase (hydrolysing)